MEKHKTEFKLLVVNSVSAGRGEEHLLVRQRPVPEVEAIATKKQGRASMQSEMHAAQRLRARLLYQWQNVLGRHACQFARQAERGVPWWFHTGGKP